MGDGDLTDLARAVLHLERTPERILEIESREGDGVLFLAREFPSARVRGVDASAAETRAATARVGLDPEGRIAFKQGRPRSLPFPDDLFDLAVQRRGRVHPREIARVLRPDGFLILVPGRARLRRFRRVEAGDSFCVYRT